jgi:PAT family acetyl-CoA transporter-like MFS transporter 1
MPTNEAGLKQRRASQLPIKQDALLKESGMLRTQPRPSALKLGDETDVLELQEQGKVVPKSPAPLAAGKSSGLSREDKRAMILLVALYLLQGIPVGLAFGSIPYLLRARLSYSQIGVFSLASYPYSLKLLWSPVVDSWYRRKWGRRKSWIVPIQYIVGLMLYWLSRNISSLMDKEVPDVHRLTFLFFTLVFFAATQGEKPFEGEWQT